MLLRLRVRKVRRKKGQGKMTGVIYLHNYDFSGSSVVVMDLVHYNSLRKKIIVAHKKLDKIKKIAGSLKFIPKGIKC